MNISIMPIASRQSAGARDHSCLFTRVYNVALVSIIFVSISDIA